MTRWSNISHFTALAALSFLLRAEPTQLPSAKDPQAAPSAKSAEEDPLGRQSPGGCATGFLKAAGRGDFARAAEYLDVRGTRAQAQELARQLKVVLDLGLSGSVESLPRTPDGDLQGGLPTSRQRVGLVKTKSGTLDVILDRVQRGTRPPIWLFSAATLRGVPRAFGEMEPKDLAKYFPSALNQIRFLWLPLWRWLTIFLAIALALISAHFVTRALMPVLRGLLRRISGERDERRLSSLKGPVGCDPSRPGDPAPWAPRDIASGPWTLEQGRGILAVIGVAWLVIRVSDIFSAASARRLLLKQASDKMALLTFISRLFKVLVVLVTVILLLRSAGVDVTAVLAGLGIGGVAVALAAQKTLENFFGGIAIIMREVVRVGHFCKIADQLGTIEDVGFASTRVRTLDRTVVSVSNAQASQTSIENYTMRDKFWFHHIFGLRYDTSAEQMRYVLAEIGNMLRTHSKVGKRNCSVLGLSNSVVLRWTSRCSHISWRGSMYGS